MSNENDKKTEQTVIDTDVEKVVVDEKKVTWSYARKRNVGNYQSEDVGIYLTDHVPKSVRNVVKWTSDKSEAVFNELKVQVWTALGLSFGFNDRGDPVLDEPAPPAVATPPSGTQVPVQTPAPVGGTPPPGPTPAPQPRLQGGDNPTMAQAGYYAPEPTFCRDCGGQGLEAFYDNRTDIDTKIQAGQPIGPDFKCRNCGGGNGPGKKTGKPTPIYRPGSYPYNEALKSGGAPPGAALAPPGVTPPPEAPPPDESGYG